MNDGDAHRGDEKQTRGGPAHRFVQDQQGACAQFINRDHPNDGCRERKAFQLLSVPLLHTTSLLVPPMAPDLRDWFIKASVSPPDTLPGMHFNLEHMTTAACVQGAGFALLLDALALDSARAGSLIALPGPTIDNPSPYTVMTKRHAKEEVMTVVQWLMRFARV